MSWIDPVNFSGKGGSKGASDCSSISIVTCDEMSSSGRKRKAKYLNNKALDPQKGGMRHRLNLQLGHWPHPPAKYKSRNKAVRRDAFSW
mmetsp:Transcript_15387/g.17716  ORF Transcript_15387/g.17716 Transcript_15387/m.17716 type:complete len:89 (-) Transcript_15387:122-388(-)